MGFRRRRRVTAVSVELEAKCKERREARVEALGSSNNQTRARYRQLNREVKAAVRRAKRQELEDIIEQMEEDLRGNNSHNLFRRVRELEAGPRKHVNAVKDKNGNILCKNKEVMERWREHFNEHLNREFPHES